MKNINTTALGLHVSDGGHNRDIRCVVDSKAEVAATNEASEDDNLPARKKGGAGSIDGQRTEDDSHMDSAEGFSL